MIYHSAPQGSDAWLAARRGVITGSRFKDARDRSDGLDDKQRVYIAAVQAGKTEPEARAEAGYKAAPSSALVAQALAGTLQKKWSAKAIGYAHDLARERCGGRCEDVYETRAMREGREQEPMARMAYEALTGEIVDEVGFITDDERIFGFSIDGRIGAKGGIEIKMMVSSETLFTAVVDGDNSEYIDQVHGAIWMLDLDWMDLVLWVPDLEAIGLHITIRRIYRDEAVIDALQEDLLAFAELVREFEKKLRQLAGNAKKETMMIENETVGLAPGDLLTELLPAPLSAALSVPSLPVGAASLFADLQTAAVPAMSTEPVLTVTSSPFPPTLRLGQIAERLGFALTADFLTKLGFAPAGKDRAAVLYHESDFSEICDALVKRIVLAKLAVK